MPLRDECPADLFSRTDADKLLDTQLNCYSFFNLMYNFILLCFIILLLSLYYCKVTLRVLKAPTNKMYYHYFY